MTDKNNKEINIGDIVTVEYMRQGGGAMPDQYTGTVVFRDGSLGVERNSNFISFYEILQNNGDENKYPMVFEVIEVPTK